MRPRYQEDLLDRYLRTVLGPLEPEATTLLRERLQWVEIGAGATLMTRGDPGESMFLVVSGRLRAYLLDDAGVERRVREMGRGQVIGEMSLYTDEPRSATVVAIRDSVLVRLDRADFHQLLARSAQLSIALTRQLIQRLQGTPSHSQQARPVTVALLPITEGVDARVFADGLAAALGPRGRVRVVDAAAMAAELHEAGVPPDADEADATRAATLRLDRIEAEHDFVLLVGNDRPDPWTQRCCRCSDEILLLADATRPPALHDTERRCLMERSGRAEAAETLVLLHPADRHCPKGTRHWLDRRPVADHLHIRPALPRDLARLARILAHEAVGLVLAGGGARGFAHLGVYRALAERGVEVDYVGGTSIGAVMAGLVASDRPIEEVLALTRKAFAVNPTGDFNLLPLLSLIKGGRLRRIIDGAVRELFGFDAEAEDLWKSFYCVASNYSQARELRLRRGHLARALRASVSIPGALPPVVIDGDLLCDGGTFNNFPVDAMREQRGIGTVIGVDLDVRKPRRIEQAEAPSTWALLRDRWRPYARRRYRFPSMMAYLMNVTILYSSSRRREAQRLTDLYFSPPLERIGMLQWNKFDAIVAQGHAHAAAVLDALPPERLERLRAGRP
ncbi:MAG TPA: patatin-like phospholipase family protein [Methylibium sp.]|nr:patatin-like phospholipase family protein [Methylibium sp.]